MNNHICSIHFTFTDHTYKDYIVFNDVKKHFCKTFSHHFIINFIGQMWKNLKYMLFVDFFQLVHFCKNKITLVSKR